MNLRRDIAWIVLFAAAAIADGVGCADRPMPLPETSADLGRGRDLAHGDLAHLDLAHLDLAHLDLAYACGGPGDCISEQCPCTENNECCSGYCDQRTYTCAAVPLLDLALAPLDLANPCGSPNDCIQAGGACVTNCDCCPGKECILQPDTTLGFCGP